ncbi:MAG: hypothetical protein WDM94_07330 [Bauldia sp.]
MNPLESQQSEGALALRKPSRRRLHRVENARQAVGVEKSPAVFGEIERDVQKFLTTLGQQPDDFSLAVRIGDAIDDPALLAAGEIRFVVENESEAVGSLPRAVARRQIVARMR